MKRVADTLFQGGFSTFPDPFGWADHPGDWQDMVVHFPLAFPNDDVRVIVTPTNLQPDSPEHTSVPVPIIRQTTSQGFLLSARNAEYDTGFAGFNWLAVHEGSIGSQVQEFPLLDARLGLTQPHRFAAFVDPQGFLPTMDRSDWLIRFSSPLTTLSKGARPVNLTSASTHGEVIGAMEAGFAGGINVNKYDVTRTVAALGLVLNESATTRDAIHIQAGNKDTVDGKCAFHWVSCVLLSRNSDLRPAFPNLIVDSGVTITPKLFAAVNTFGDWQSWEIYFERPFDAPPIVLVTGTEQGTHGKKSPAVQGIVADVTRYGFSIAARNSDIADGEANFCWVAFGCGEGCG